MLGVVTSTEFPSSPGDPRLQKVQPAGAVGRASGSVQIARKINVPLVPPNPKEFDMATLIFIGRAMFGT